MAYLLGNRFCIDSLHNDVSDLQDAVTDVVSRTGPVGCPSWKYPDKQALHVDISELLEQYKFSDDEEERQVSHVVLLELVIDRLVLLLQAMSGYMDQIIALSRNTSSAVGGKNSNSIGLAVKKYWNKLVHVFTVAQQLQSENKSRKLKIADLENSLRKLNLESGRPPNETAIDNLSAEAVELLTNSGLLDTTRDSSSPKAKDISHDEYNKSTQTVETAFVPCESCHEVQKCLRCVGDTVTSVCQSEGLPCALVKYMEEIQGMDWLTSNDVSRWTVEQNKDLERINKHLRSLYEMIDPLKRNVTEAKEAQRKAQEKAANCEKQMKAEKDTLRTQQKQFQSKLENANKEHKEEVEKIKHQVEQVLAEKRHLEEQLEAMRGEVRKQTESLTLQEKTRNDLQEQLKESDANAKQLENLQDEVKSLQQKLDSTKEKLKEANKELNKEKTKTRSFSRHQDSVKGKQEHLLNRIDELDKENSDMQDRVAELEDQEDELREEKRKIQDALDRANERCQQAVKDLQEQKDLLRRVEAERCAVEDSMKELEDEVRGVREQLQEAKERERLIIDYPDLNGPVNPDITGTGDVALDMENQVRANSVRIKVLEDQNSGLRKAISKMLRPQTSQQNLVVEERSEPLQLWHDHREVYEQRSPSKETRHDHNDRAGNGSSLYGFSSPPSPTPSPSKRGSHKILQNNFVVSPPPQTAAGRTRNNTRPPSGHQQKQQRPPSGVSQRGSGKQSSINLYTNLKNGGQINRANSAEMRYLLDRGKNKPTNHVDDEESDFPQEYANDVVSCSKCDKMYKNREDLAIHQSYCFANI